MKGKIQLFTLYIVVAVCGLVFGGCSSPVVRKSNVDTPENHCTAGLQKLDAGDLVSAETEFARSLELDGDSPLGHACMAFVELRRSNYRLARKYAGTAVKKDDRCVEAHTALGMAVAAGRHGDSWYGEALSHFEKALEIAPDNERALFNLADTHYRALAYERSIEVYTRTAGLGGAFAERAGKRATFVRKVMQARPATDSGRAIVEKDAINRADLCVLLVDELEVKSLLELHRPEVFRLLFTSDYKLRKRSVEVASEVTSNRAHNKIVEVIHLGIPFMGLYPDGRFLPDRQVTKSLMAVVLEWTLVLVTGDDTHATKYIGMASPFKDVHTRYHAFNAINLSLEKGLFNVPEDGLFKPESPLSGIDALLVMRKAVEEAGPR